MLHCDEEVDSRLLIRTGREWWGFMSPEVLREGPFRFFFWSGDRGHPPHIHVRRDDKTARFSLEPVQPESSGRMTAKEIGQIQKIITRNRDTMLRAWYETFRE